MYYTYEHIRPDTGAIFYVGKGCKNRAYNKINRNSHWKRIVNKNNGNFEVRIINWFNNEDDAFHAEIYHINQLKEKYSLANKTTGGEGISGCIRYDMRGDNSWMRKPEHIERMSGDSNPMRQPGVAEKAASKNRGQKRSPEFCKKYQGENNPMFGRVQSEKQKKAVSASQLGKPKGYSQRTKTSAKVSGKNNGMFGKTGELNPMFGKVSAMKGKKNPIAAFANYIRYIHYWGA